MRDAVGAVLRAKRTEQGRTLREVSDGARIALGYLSEVERGRKEVSSELLELISGALGVSVEAVLADTVRYMVAVRREPLVVRQLPVAA